MKFWIARDEDGDLFLYNQNPSILKTEVDVWDCFESSDKDFLVISKEFPEVTFENSPQEVEIKLVNNTTNGFAEDLLINCIPLEGEFSKFVDDNFEHLI